MEPTLELACELIRRRSITPEDAGCQQLIAERLAPLGCRVQHLRYGDVDNLWLVHGTGSPLFLLLGHTDVVPPGPEQNWRSPPFEPDIRDGMLYGRGAADMKGGVAAMTVAMERLIRERPDHPGTLALLLTSDEEGSARDGVRRVVAEYLEPNKIRVDYCLVGEPASHARVGDVIKIGRRGSLGGRLTVRGVQGHVAYPQFADNPVHKAMTPLALLCETEWDAGNADFPPTSFQISNIHAGTGADNVIPDTLEVLFNFRYSTELSAEQLRQRIHAVLDAHPLDYRIDWHLSGEPFLTRGGRLVDTARAVLRDSTGREPELSTSGGTSDGRFIAPTGAQVIEIGPVNKTIHKVDECIATADLETLAGIYACVAKELLTTRA